MGAEVGPHRVEGAAHPVLQPERVEVVEDKQGCDEVVVGQAFAQRRVLSGQLQDAGQAAAVELGDQADDVLHLLEGAAVEGRFEVTEELLDPVADDSEVNGWSQGPPSVLVDQSRLGMPLGECSLRSTLPLPRYMWTPQGRHGSKLRTARMMSIPLKSSIPFSSKIGVFMTASS